jgi:hypothetical protein
VTLRYRGALGTRTCNYDDKGDEKTGVNTDIIMTHGWDFDGKFTGTNNAK